jgi:hypothetical protein
MGRKLAPPAPGLPLLEQLIRAHEQELLLTRELLLAQGTADEMESQTTLAFDRAAAHPWDEALADQAVAAALALDTANECELEAAERWNCHRVWTRGLLEEAQTLMDSTRIARTG